LLTAQRDRKRGERNSVFRWKSITVWMGAALFVLACTTPGLGRGRHFQGNHNEGHPGGGMRQPASRSVPRPPQTQGISRRSAPSPAMQGHHAGQWLRRYKDLPPAEQERALSNDPQFRHLSPERQERLRARLQHFSSLPPAQQQRVLNRMETWEHLTPAQKQDARQLFRQMREMPPDRRHMLESAIRDLRAMPPDARQRVINSDRFRSTFTPEERNMLDDVTKLPLAPAEPPSPPGQAPHP
jgi:Protein of unknown function (DUF3106)